MEIIPLRRYPGTNFPIFNRCVAFLYKPHKLNARAKPSLEEQAVSSVYKPISVSYQVESICPTDGRRRMQCRGRKAIKYNNAINAKYAILNVTTNTYQNSYKYDRAFPSFLFLSLDNNTVFLSSPPSLFSLKDPFLTLTLG